MQVSHSANQTHQSKTATCIAPPPGVLKQDLLHLYFASASQMGDRSSQGAIEDRHIFNKRTLYCQTCEGSGECTKALDDWLEKRANFERLGSDIDKYPHAMPEIGKCSTCKGSGGVMPNSKKPPRIPTAKPKGSSVQPGSVEFGEERVLRAGSAAKLMRRVGRKNPAHARALELYYGDCGERCLGAFGDRIYGVIGEFTKWGQEAMKRGTDAANETARAAYTDKDPDWRHEDGVAHGVDPGLREIKRAATNPDATSRVRFDAAYTQAYQLLVAASKTWDSCCEEH